VKGTGNRDAKHLAGRGETEENPRLRGRDRAGKQRRSWPTPCPVGRKLLFFSKVQKKKSLTHLGNLREKKKSRKSSGYSEVQGGGMAITTKISLQKIKAGKVWLRSGEGVNIVSQNLETWSLR